MSSFAFNWFTFSMDQFFGMMILPWMYWMEAVSPKMRLGSEKKSLCRYFVKDVDQSQWDFMLPTMHLDNIITSIHNLGLKYPNKKTRLSQSIVFFPSQRYTRWTYSLTIFVLTIQGFCCFNRIYSRFRSIYFGMV